MAVVHPTACSMVLDCAKGGLVKKDYRDLCDSDAKTADMAWGEVSVCWCPTQNNKSLI